MSDELFENDGKQVGTLRWPFKKYTILMPEKNDVDAFAWLFASFVRMYNRKKKNPEFTYNNDIENVVKGMIRQHFGNIIDVPTLNKVIETTKEKYLDPEKHDSIKVFNNLFTDKMQIRYIFQDCITGSVAPYFYTEYEAESEIPYEVDFEGGLKPIKRDKPAKKYVKLAYRRYLNRDQYLLQDSEVNLQDFEKEEEILDDEDAQLFEDDEDLIDNMESEEIQPKTDRKSSKFDIKFLNDGREVYYDLPVTIEDNKLLVKTPFDPSTNPWMNVCFTKGSNENKDIKEYRDRYSSFLVPQQKVDRFFEDPKDSIYNKLPNCVNIYRTIEKTGKRELRDMVWRMEGLYARRDPYFFLECSKMLEGLVRIADYEPSDAEFRNLATKDTVDRLLKAKCTNIDTWHLRNPEVFKKWKFKYVKPENFPVGKNWKPRDDFKSDFLDLMLQSDLSKSPLMKYDSVNNIWSLWVDRNSQGHYNEDPKRFRVSPESLKTMEESVNLLCQVIKRGAQ